MTDSFIYYRLVEKMAMGRLVDKLASDTVLQPHQQRVVEKMKKNKGLLVYHGLGSGKTLTSLSVANSLKLPVTVIGPASLRTNFDKEKKKHKIKSKVNYYSYNKPPTKKDHGLLVFEEAHNMGNIVSKRSKYPQTYKGSKVLMLTGTPIRNYPYEIAPLLAPIGADLPTDVKKFKEMFIGEKEVWPGFFAAIFRRIKPGHEFYPKNLDKFKKEVKDLVDYYENSAEGYPKVLEKEIDVTMTKKQQAAYNMAMRGRPDLAYKIRHGIDPSKSEKGAMNAFLVATRQIMNYPGGYNTKATLDDAPKIVHAVDEIKKRIKSDPNYRGVTYSAFLNSGIHPMAERLEQEKIPFAIYTGKQTQKEKDEAVKQLNAGKIKHLLISGAGGQGLDLKGVKLLQLLEPHWNDPVLEQVRGRVARYKSHDHLPENERVVEINQYIGKPNKKIFRSGEIGADEYLKNLSEKKKKLNNAFLDILREGNKK